MSLFSSKTKQKLNDNNLSKLTPVEIQQEYNTLCAEIGQDVIRIEDLNRAQSGLVEQINIKKKRVFELLQEMPKARDRAKEAQAEGDKDAKSL